VRINVGISDGTTSVNENSLEGFDFDIFRAYQR
jgi:hypothetical protein